MKTADFKLRTRNRKLDDPTQLADRIFRTGLSLLEKETDGTRFRLIGIGVSDLRDAGLADPPDASTNRRGAGPRRKRRWTSCATSLARAASRPAIRSERANNSCAIVRQVAQSCPHRLAPDIF